MISTTWNAPITEFKDKNEFFEGRGYDGATFAMHKAMEFCGMKALPSFICNDVIKNPKNPFTGNEINNAEKTAHEQFIIVSKDWDVLKNNGNTFLPARWASVKENLWERKNWTFYDEEIILNEHAFP